MPNRSTARTPSAGELGALADDLVDRPLRDSGKSFDRAHDALSPGQAKSGITTSSSDSDVSRTSARSVSVRRSRRSRVAGKVLTPEA